LVIFFNKCITLLMTNKWGHKMKSFKPRVQPLKKAYYGHFFFHFFLRRKKIKRI
jgi:hypothetical protein